MRFIFAFLLITGSAFAQCGPGGCPPQRQYPQWGMGAGVRIDQNGFGVGIGGGVQRPQIQPQHDPRSVVRISANYAGEIPATGDDADNSGGYFSGVVVAGNLLLTAKHCLGDAKPSLYAEIGGQKLPLEYVAISDFTEGPVVLRVPGGPYPSAKVAAGVPKRGGVAYGAGYVDGQRSASLIMGRMNGSRYFTMSHGSVSESTPEAPGSYQANILMAPAYVGQSGCPLFDSAGDVIGLLSSSDHRTDSQWICWSQTKLAVEIALKRVGVDDPAPIAERPGNPAPPFAPQPVDNSIRAEIAELKAMLIQIQGRTVDAAPGPPGDRGPAGVDGKDGLPGKAADPTELADMREMLALVMVELRNVKESQASVPSDLAALRAELQAIRDIEFPVRSMRPDGTILNEYRAKLGDPIQYGYVPK